ncbi:MAG TPA: tetratricopeptide repeat protein, partial [Xanthomonadaceae bacterium]|nr:tetratricopeptide repeat protein [Xanthomonadaceae bacterium]
MARILHLRSGPPAAICAAVFAIAAAGSAHCADDPDFPSPASTPVEEIRRQFVATADHHVLEETAKAVSGLHDPDGKVIPSECKARADALQRAARHDPLSLAVWYYQTKCAEALGNAALQQQSEKAFEALVRDAFAGVPPDNGATPLHLESAEDGNAIVDATGETMTFSYFDISDLATGLIWRAGLLDPETGRERRLSFEFLQRRLQLFRDPTLLTFPLMRLIAERDIAYEGVKDPAKPPSGEPRTLEYLGGFTPDQQAAQIKALTADGSPSIPYVLGRYCFLHLYANCATAAVDALLPLAEKHRAEPMILLAYAEANGLGVKADESAAKALLGGAAKQESTGAVYAYYRDLDLSRLAAAKPFERWVYAQVSAAADSGDKLAAAVAVRLETANSDYERNPSRLQRWQRDADAVGLTDFTSSYCISVALKAKNGPAAIGCLHTAGSDRYAAAYLARVYERGNLPGVPADPTKALYWRTQAAILGDATSMRLMGRHYAAESNKPGSLSLAEKWYLSATLLDDNYAALNLAELGANDKLHPEIGQKAAVKIYQAMLESDPGDLGPSVRRHFAGMLAKGQGTPRDPARARALLMQDALAGDPFSQLELANLLYDGSLGTRDLAGATAWV